MKAIDVPERLLDLSSATMDYGTAVGMTERIKDGRVGEFFTGATFKFPRGGVVADAARTMIEAATDKLDDVYVGRSLWFFPWGSTPTRMLNAYMDRDFHVRAVVEAQSLADMFGAHSFIDVEMATTKPGDADKGHGPQREELWAMTPDRRAAVGEIVESVASTGLLERIDLAYCDHGKDDFAAPFRLLAERHWCPATYKMRGGFHPHADNRYVWCSWVGEGDMLSVSEACSMDIPDETKLYGVYATRAGVANVIDAFAEANHDE